jgi:hypothetical protein
MIYRVYVDARTWPVRIFWTGYDGAPLGLVLLGQAGIRRRGQRVQLFTGMDAADKKAPTSANVWGNLLSTDLGPVFSPTQTLVQVSKCINERSHVGFYARPLVFRAYKFGGFVWDLEIPGPLPKDDQEDHSKGQ